jgi:tRNA threonylcarbamoyladenosine biosynthesis protein TsaE
VDAEALLGADAPGTPDRTALQRWGRALGAALRPPALVTLAGDVGAGKTTLARALCEGLGVTDLDAVTSPTFAILQGYPSPVGTVWHADLYRLRAPADLEALGWEELVATAPVLLIEWPEIAAGTLPPHAVHLRLDHDPADPDRRCLTVTRGEGPA